MKKKAPTRKSKKDPLESEVSVKLAIKSWSSRVYAICAVDAPIVTLAKGNKILARLDLREFVKKRRPLTGVTKRLRKAVR